MEDAQQLKTLITDRKLVSDPMVLDRILAYYELLLAENRVQNLTRLISPKDFIEGHLLDVLTLIDSGFLQYPALDLGSGPGVPGLLASLFSSNPWVLVESEKSKATFLENAAQKLVPTHTQVYYGRVEEYLKVKKVQSIVCRAVGTVEKIYGWLRPCSTWNNLILFKGPGWEKEWGERVKSSKVNELKVVQEKKYSVGDEKKERILIKLVRA